MTQILVYRLNREIKMPRNAYMLEKHREIKMPRKFDASKYIENRETTVKSVISGYEILNIGLYFPFVNEIERLAKNEMNKINNSDDFRLSKFVQETPFCKKGQYWCPLEVKAKYHTGLKKCRILNVNEI